MNRTVRDLIRTLSTFSPDFPVSRIGIAISDSVFNYEDNFIEITDKNLCFLSNISAVDENGEKIWKSRRRMFDAS